MLSFGVGLALSAFLSDGGFAAGADVGPSFLQVRGSTTSGSNRAYLDRFQFERQQSLLQFQDIEPSSDLERLVLNLTQPGTGEYGYQSVRTDTGALTNIILVICPVGDHTVHARQMIEKHRHEILFLGLSSYEDYPLQPPNPWSGKFEAPDVYVGLFDGWLNMYRHPEEIYPEHVKTVLLSQSDFHLPEVERVAKTSARCSEGTDACVLAAPVKRAWFGKLENDWTRMKGRDVTAEVQKLQKQGMTTVQASNDNFGDTAMGDVKTLVVEFEGLPKEEPKYDFIFSGSNQDVSNDCVGWSSYAKNWSFAKEAFDVMCKEYGLKGVVIAARRDDVACSIPESCKDLVVETNYMDQQLLFEYMKQSRFMFLPQVHDASPRVAPQGLSHNLPLLMNRNIIGGWKYLNEKTGESFHDLSDFRQALETLLRKEKNGEYTPQEFIYETAGSEKAGTTFRKFIEENFADRVKLPLGTKSLTPY